MEEGLKTAAHEVDDQDVVGALGPSPVEFGHPQSALQLLIDAGLIFELTAFVLEFFLSGIVKEGTSLTASSARDSRSVATAIMKVVTLVDIAERPAADASPQSISFADRDSFSTHV